MWWHYCQQQLLQYTHTDRQAQTPTRLCSVRRPLNDLDWATAQSRCFNAHTASLLLPLMLNYLTFRWYCQTLSGCWLLATVHSVRHSRGRRSLQWFLSSHSLSGTNCRLLFTFLLWTVQNLCSSGRFGHCACASTHHSEDEMLKSGEKEKEVSFSFSLFLQAVYLPVSPSSSSSSR